MRRQDKLRLNYFGQCEPLKQRKHIRANGRTLRGIAHRKASSAQDRAFERIDGTDIRFVSTSSDEGAESNLPKDDANGRIDPAILS